MDKCKPLMVGKGGAAVASMKRETGVAVRRCSLKPIEPSLRPYVGSKDPYVIGRESD